MLIDAFGVVDKEVQGYYEEGMTVPDDITLLWTDDKYVLWFVSCDGGIADDHVGVNSFGNVRRYPLVSERNRTGGAGVYYHVCFENQSSR